MMQIRSTRCDRIAVHDWMHLVSNALRRNDTFYTAHQTETADNALWLMKMGNFSLASPKHVCAVECVCPCKRPNLRIEHRGRNRVKKKKLREICKFVIERTTTVLNGNGAMASVQMWSSYGGGGGENWKIEFPLVSSMQKRWSNSMRNEFGDRRVDCESWLLLAERIFMGARTLPSVRFSRKRCYKNSECECV